MEEQHSLDDPVDIPLGKLHLWLENPRIGGAESEHQAAADIIAQAPDHMLELAGDIAQLGLSPIDLFAVIAADNGEFVVREGNRRLVALRALHDPSIFGVARPQVEKLNRESVPTSVRCVVFNDTTDLDDWLLRRHGTDMGGAGTQRWNAYSRVKFEQSRGQQPTGQAAMGAGFIELVEQTFPPTKQLRHSLDTLKSDKLTTLGRLVSDPDFRQATGVTVDKGALIPSGRFSERSAWTTKALNAVAGEIGVSNIKSKSQRAAFIAKHFPQGDEPDQKGQDDPTGQDGSKSPTGSARNGNSGGGRSDPDSGRPNDAGGGSEGSNKPDKPALKPPFMDQINTDNFGPRVRGLHHEMANLKPSKFPNATAVLLRCLADMTVQAYIEAGHSNSTAHELGQRCLDVANDIISSEDLKGSNAASLRQVGRKNGTLPTLNGIVHNEDHAPAPSDVESYAQQMRPLLNAMNRRMGSK